jgi:uncharacterized protein YndB with AHSA1/START domain
MRFSTISQSVTIQASPLRVYEAFMDSKKHAEFTGDKATIQAEVGGKFKVGDGYISGTNLELVAGKKIVQEWTTTEWPKGYPPSRLKITLTAKGKGTLLKMVHSNVPAEQRNYYAEGWKDFYWAPMKKYFAAKRPSKK